jgi:hypothetical protein
MGRGRRRQAVYVERNGKSLVGRREQEIGGVGHAVGKVCKCYKASIKEDGNKVQVSELCAGQSSQIFPNRQRFEESLNAALSSAAGFQSRRTTLARTLRLQGLA